MINIALTDMYYYLYTCIITRRLKENNHSVCDRHEEITLFEMHEQLGLLPIYL